MRAESFKREPARLQANQCWSSSPHTKLNIACTGKPWGKQISHAPQGGQPPPPPVLPMRNRLWRRVAPGGVRNEAEMRSCCQSHASWQADKAGPGRQTESLAAATGQRKRRAARGTSSLRPWTTPPVKSNEEISQVGKAARATAADFRRLCVCLVVCTRYCENRR